MNEPGFDDTVCKESACWLKTKVGFFFYIIEISVYKIWNMQVCLVFREDRKLPEE